MFLAVSGTDDQIALAVSQFRDLGAIAFSEPGRIVVECRTPDVERAVRDALELVPKIQ